MKTKYWNQCNQLQKSFITLRDMKRRLLDFFLERNFEIERARKLSLSVAYVYHAIVEGDIAEFGTCSGRTASYIASAMQRHERLTKPKRLHLFDSFEGHPEPEHISDKTCAEIKSGVWHKGACSGISKERLRKVCEKFLPNENIIIHPGWFKNTLPNLSKETRFSMVHIDCDLYQSTIEVLNYLFKNKIIQEGTTICFNGYLSSKASSKHGERKAWVETVKKYLVDYSEGGGVWLLFKRVYNTFFLK